MTSLSIDRHRGKSISYDVLIPGLNYRIDEMRSALGIVQLSKLDKNNTRRSRLVSHYKKSLKNISQITVPWQTIPKTIEPSYHIFPVLVSDDTNREGLINHLKQNGVQTSIHYPAYNQFTYYGNVIREDVKISNYISDHVVTLPLYPDLKIEQIDYISRQIDNYFKVN